MLRAFRISSVSYAMCFYCILYEHQQEIYLIILRNVNFLLFVRRRKETASLPQDMTELRTKSPSFLLFHHSTILPLHKLLVQVSTLNYLSYLAFCFITGLVTQPELQKYCLSTCNKMSNAQIKSSQCLETGIRTSTSEVLALKHKTCQLQNEFVCIPVKEREIPSSFRYRHDSPPQITKLQHTNVTPTFAHSLRHTDVLNSLTQRMILNLVVYNHFPWKTVLQLLKRTQPVTQCVVSGFDASYIGIIQNKLVSHHTIASLQLRLNWLKSTIVISLTIVSSSQCFRSLPF